MTNLSNVGFIFEIYLITISNHLLNLQCDYHVILYFKRKRKFKKGF